MYVIMVSSECAPVAKIGGLADVVYGLSRELQIRGNEVEVILPKYDCMRFDHIWGLHIDYNDLWVPWYDGYIHCTVWAGYVHGIKCYFIDPHSQDHFFNRGGFYGYWDEPVRYSFFSKAALQYMLVANKRPDIIHTHDWQASMVPVLLYEQYQSMGMYNQRVCHTIHNFKHQGVTGSEVLYATGLKRPEYFYHIDRLQDNANPYALNLLKGGIVYSNTVTTVSPHHAWEARFTDQGFGLGHTLFVHQDKFSGVLNGLDYNVWNPEVDSLLSFQYTAKKWATKKKNKSELRKRFFMYDDQKPLISYVGRLDPQKGVHLIQHAIYYALANQAQFFLLGTSPESHINDQFWSIKNHLNDNPDCHLEIGFNEELAHLLYAASDIIIVPSAFEPCGLTQLIALKYGTVPVVRSVGGLLDTVFDWDYADTTKNKRNGFVFDHLNNEGLEFAMKRALDLWYENPKLFQQLARNGMNYDYSWNHPGQQYLELYDQIRHR